ncbi:MAG: serine/threonine-protein kinase [Polyangiales bacterium]
MSTLAGTDADDDREALPAGAVFGPYEIVRKLGQGAFGMVYEAVRTPLGKRVALKVLRAQTVFPVETLTRFVREAQTAARLTHPHIVDVFDVGVHAGTPFLAMEYLEGETLAARISREGRLSPRDVANIMVPVISAVAKVHDAGIVHRDLKPENLFLTVPRPGVIHPKLLDFGIARVAEDKASPAITRTNSILGTPYYMSPEQIQRSRSVDARADQWALGVILHEALSGALPFDGETLLAVLSRVAAGAPPPLRSLVPTVPDALEAAVTRALSVDPAQRFPSVRDLGRVLLPFASTAVRTSWSTEFGDGTTPSTPPAQAPPDEPGLRDTPLAPEAEPPAAKKTARIETVVGAPPVFRRSDPPKTRGPAVAVAALVAVALTGALVAGLRRGPAETASPHDHAALDARDASLPHAGGTDAGAVVTQVTAAPDASEDHPTTVTVNVTPQAAGGAAEARARSPRHGRDDAHTPRAQIVITPSLNAPPITPQPPQVTRGTAGVPIL